MEHVLKQTKTVNVFFSQKKLQEDQSWLSDAKISDTPRPGYIARPVLQHPNLD